jgi:hypothetical protein
MQEDERDIPTEDGPTEDKSPGSLGEQVAKMSMRMRDSFVEEGFTAKESFDLLKLWCAPNYAVIVKRMYDAEVAEERAEAMEAMEKAERGKVDLALPGKPHIRRPRH